MPGARERLDGVLDPGWVERDASMVSSNPLGFPGYEPGRVESTVAASGSCDGHPVEAVAFDFEVFGGSMGVVAGEKIVRAFERACERRGAVLAMTAAGGARMQEGMAALAQMPKTVVARRMLADAHLPFVSWLGDPTTGGVYASFATLADLVWASPDATIGFAGPRVAERVTGRPLPPGSHTADFALANGLVDATVRYGDLRALLARTLALAIGGGGGAAVTPPPEPGPSGASAWDEVSLARHADRPTGADVAEAVAGDIVEIRGDRAGGADSTVLAGLGRIAGSRCMVVALDRRNPTPAGFRTAARAVEIAGRLRLPVVTFVDTPGADPSSEAEAAGVAHAIAACFAAVLEHPAPVVAVVTGEGGSGGALALACGDRLLALEHSIFSVIGPEAAAAILRRDDVEQVAEDLRLTAADLRRLGLADRIVAEPAGGAHLDRAAAAQAVAASIAWALADMHPTEAPMSRIRRWRDAGAGFVS